MKKVIVLFMGLFLFASSVFADEINDRKGFFAGFGLGGGALRAHSDIEVATFTSLRIGGGISGILKQEYIRLIFQPSIF